MKDFLHSNLSNKTNSNNEEGTNSDSNILFDNKIWIVVHEDGTVYYSNNRCKKELSIFEGDSFSKLSTEPDIIAIIGNLKKYNYNNFVFELIADIGGNSTVFNVELERITIEHEIYFILIFNSLDNKSKLEKKISNLHHALEYGQIPVIMTDECGKIIYATKSFEKLLELDLDIIYNNHIASVLSWYLNNDEIADVQAAIIKGNTWSTNIYIKGDTPEAQVLDLKLNPICDEDGVKNNFILTAHDVSLYYHRNKMIKKSEEKLRSIINNISDLLLIFRIQEGEIIYEDANQNFKEIFNLNEIKTGRKLNKNFPHEFYVKLSTSCNLMRKNDLASVEFDSDGPKGKSYAAKLSFQYDENIKDTIYLLSLRDITERIKNEIQVKEAYKKEQQMNKLKTTFLQNMSHELRTPATAILGYSEIMKDCLINNDFEAVEQITKSLENVIKRLINLFTKIIEISDLDSEEIELNTVKLNCNKIIKSVYDSTFDDAAKKNLDYSLRLTDTQDLIEIDWCKFEKAILYVVDNAIKYTENGSISLSTVREENSIVISVVDSGKGMNQNIIDRLLQPFVQEEEDGLTREYEGAGLGLTIANRYTKLMGGEMIVESYKNKGTNLKLIFPIVNSKVDF